TKTPEKTGNYTRSEWLLECAAVPAVASRGKPHYWEFYHRVSVPTTCPMAHPRLLPGGRAAPCPRMRKRCGVASRASMNLLTTYLIYVLPCLVLFVLHVCWELVLCHVWLQIIESSDRSSAS